MAYKYQRTEIAKHFRNRLKHEGVKARVKSYYSCGWEVIAVDTPVYDYSFSEREQKAILVIADCIGLIRPDYHRIDTTQMTYGPGGHFYIPADLVWNG